MENKIQEFNEANKPRLLENLRSKKVRNSWAIQDLLLWPERSKCYFIDGSEKFSYLLISGHPASHGHPTLILDGDPESVANLLGSIQLKDPFVIRETSTHLLSVIKDFYPDAKVYLEQRMDVTQRTFQPRHRGLARGLKTADAKALAQFFGAPPQAAAKFEGWLGGAKAFYGVFEGDQIAAIGSSMVSIPDAWNLVSIESHKDFRKKGYATEVTSTLVERALLETETVTVTVVKENLPAIRTYEKVGFKFSEDRIWVDNGTGSTP